MVEQEIVLREEKKYPLRTLWVLVVSITLVGGEEDPLSAVILDKV